MGLPLNVLSGIISNGDQIPSDFNFTPATAVVVSTLTTSNTVTLAGLNRPTPITIVGGAYQINSGSFVSTPGTINNGDTLTVQGTSSAIAATLTHVTVTVGGLQKSFDITTA